LAYPDIVFAVLNTQNNAITVADLTPEILAGPFLISTFVNARLASCGVVVRELGVYGAGS